MRAIVAATAGGGLPATPVVVISNNRDSEALAFARQHGIAAHHLSAKVCGDELRADQAIATALEQAGVQLVILSGYMRKLGPMTLARFRDRIINIHPALLPKHGGQGMYGARVHAAVVAAGGSPPTGTQWAQRVGRSPDPARSPGRVRGAMMAP